MRTVRDENELPAPEAVGASCYYLRCKYEPTLVIHSTTGELFAREDGEKWTEGAYQLHVKDTGVERTIRFGWCDGVQYGPRRVASAA